jgi:CPA1 family monovalent cation:H+ antiporter
MLSPTSRLRTLGFWEALTFVLESLLFLLIGLQLPHITRGLEVVRPLEYGALVLIALIAVRMVWMFTVPLVVRVALPSRGEPPQTSAELLVLGWSGMRGGVSLAAALALPLIADGHAFPNRSDIILIAYIAIAASLVIEGLTLSPLVRRLGLSQEDALAREEARAHVALAQTALRHIDELAEREDLAEAIAEPLRMTFEQRIHRLEPEADDDAVAGDEAAVASRIRDLRRELIAVERRRLGQLRRRGEISAETVRRIEHELDLEESRLSS